MLFFLFPFINNANEINREHSLKIFLSEVLLTVFIIKNPQIQRKEWLIQRFYAFFHVMRLNRSSFLNFSTKFLPTFEWIHIIGEKKLIDRFSLKHILGKKNL